jgi:hypothetical protein
MAWQQDAEERTRQLMARMTKTKHRSRADGQEEKPRFILKQ